MTQPRRSSHWPRRELFALPKGIYLDGNSLGLMPLSAHQAVVRRLGEWQTQAVSGWDEWFGMAESLSPALARLVGASPREVIATGSITSNLHALLATLYRPQGERKHLLATALDFPTDLYALQSWAELRGAEVRLIPSRDGQTIHEDDLRQALGPDIALVLLPTVLYRSGQLLDVAKLTAIAHRSGALIGWDAAHSIGAMQHAFHDAGADFAVWCSYKYLNAGPGAPGGLFLHQRHHHLAPALRGWWGNEKESQFEMTTKFRPAPGAAAYQQGTPPILALAALEGALEVYEQTDLAALRARSLALTDLLMELADLHLHDMRVLTPRDHARRGGHVSLSHPHARALSVALRQRQIIPDYRSPDVLRLAPIAFYNTEDEIREVVRVLRELLDSGSYKDVTEVGAVT
ncbi:kynureninase [Deinococcus psychrotolerans]|uniref:Kynureninase n=1 Tax=Deinococcus psychrotolerans TaxID=2489213 RepID=A0A3G8YDC2_9DEIO|nr:kynureninase [Deinococcus psychrotolerans]AZI42237.1 kynureninase [Deinococcus psychrotolerans]